LCMSHPELLKQKFDKMGVQRKRFCMPFLKGMRALQKKFVQFAQKTLVSITFSWYI
jgi:hypothetical protein